MADSNVLMLPVRTTPAERSGESVNKVPSRPASGTNGAKRKVAIISVRLADLVEAISDGFALYDKQDRLVVWNEKFANILHYAKDMMAPGVQYETLVRKCAIEHFLNKKVSSEQREAWIQEAFHFHRIQSTYERTTADGTCYLVSRRRSNAGFTAVVWTDITERKRVENALKQSEQLYRELFEGSLHGIVIQNRKQILQFNRAFASIFCLTPEIQFKATNDLERIIAPHERDRLRQIRLNVFKMKSGSSNFEFQGLRLDGNPLWLQSSSMAIRWNGETAIHTTFQDITTRKEFEEELLSKKLESIGVLAHGIAVEFHKVYSAVMAEVRLAKMEAYSAGMESVTERITEAERLGASAAELVQQLLVLHRGGAPVMERTTVEELLRKAMPPTGEGHNVVSLRKDKPGVKIEFGRGLWPIRGDRSQLIGVLRSLIGSSMHSMPFVGELEVLAENVTLERKAKGIPLPPGKYVKVTIADQGRPLPEEALQRIFDPYFAPYQRPGDLALAGAYSVVKRHGGAITVASRPGKGTRMMLFLPAVTEPRRRDHR